MKKNIFFTRIFTVLGLISVGAMSAQPAFAFDFEDDVPADIQKQIKDDLKFMGSMEGGTASLLHQKIFGMVDGPTYHKFFDTRVEHVGMNSCGSGNAVACVIPMFGSSTIWLTQNYVKFSHPQVAKMMVVYHEARHTEDDNGNWSHAICPKPFLDDKGQPMKSIWTGAFLAGEAACDSTPFGSYGSSMIMLKNIQKFCTNCSEKVKMDAGIYADNQLLRVTNVAAKNAILKDLY